MKGLSENKEKYEYQIGYENHRGRLCALVDGNDINVTVEEGITEHDTADTTFVGVQCVVFAACMRGYSPKLYESETPSVSVLLLKRASLAAYPLIPALTYETASAHVPNRRRRRREYSRACCGRWSRWDGKLGRADGRREESIYVFSSSIG